MNAHFGYEVVHILLDGTETRDTDGVRDGVEYNCDGEIDAQIIERAIYDVTEQAWAFF